MHEKSEKTALMLFLLVLAVPALLLFIIDSAKRNEKSRFLAQLQAEIESGGKEIKMSDIAAFEWDHVEILINDAPGSFSEGINLHSFLQENDIKYSYFDTLYAPSIAELLGLQNDYETAIIFIKNRHVSKIYLFQDFTLRIGDTSYHLHNATQDMKNDRSSVFMKVANKKTAEALLKEIGIQYIADLILFNKEEG